MSEIQVHDLFVRERFRCASNRSCTWPSDLGACVAFTLRMNTSPAYTEAIVIRNAVKLLNSEAVICQIYSSM